MIFEKYLSVIIEFFSNLARQVKLLQERLDPEPE